MWVLDQWSEHLNLVSETATAALVLHLIGVLVSIFIIYEIEELKTLPSGSQSIFADIFVAIVKRYWLAIDLGIIFANAYNLSQDLFLLKSANRSDLEYGLDSTV